MSEPDPVNIASHLTAMARSQPHRLAVVFPEGRNRRGQVCYSHYTYRQLDEASDRIAWVLDHKGLFRRGIHAAVMVPLSLDFFALTFALFKLGAVPVFIDPGMGVKNIGNCLAEAKPEAFIGIRKAHWARLLLGWGRQTIRTKVMICSTFSLGTWSLDACLQQEDLVPSEKLWWQIAETQPDETAAILFTSGSTGVPKGVVYTHQNFAAQVESLRRTFRIEPGEIDLCTFPLFALFAPALGMTAIIPDMDFSRPANVDPKKIFESIEDFGVTNMFGSPALIDRVGRYGSARDVWLPTLKRVISAGAPVRADILERFSKLLAPGAQVFTPYGATEALPVTSIGSREILTNTRPRTDRGGGVCVGRPVEGITVAIIKIFEEPINVWSDDLLLPAGQIGEICVKGPVVTIEYYRRPDSTVRAKILDFQDGGFYHRMGDLGYLDDDGRLWFCGRKSHRVVTSRGTLFTVPCEAIFNTHPRVFRTALVGVHRNETMQPVLCVELEKSIVGKVPKEKVRQELLDLGQSNPKTVNIRTILFHDSFPVDVRHNSKIFREKLADWAMRKLS